MAKSKSSSLLQTSTTHFAEILPRTNIQSLCRSTAVSTRGSASHVQSLVHPPPDSESILSTSLHQTTIVSSSVQQQPVTVLGAMSTSLMVPSTHKTVPTVNFAGKGNLDRMYTAGSFIIAK